MVAEYLHKRVWFWDQEHGGRPGPWHLLIRRMPKEDGKGWVYKYSLSNAGKNASKKRLAFQQSQRLWVEQAIKDGKDGLGLDEYQVRKWRTWRHHVALTMLAGLYVLKTKLENRGEFPLLSITDVRDILAYFLPQKVITYQDLMYRIAIRRRRRESSYDSARRRSLEWAVNREGGYGTN